MTLAKNKSQYVFVTRRTYQFGASRYCLKHGMKLASVKDQETLQHLYDVAKPIIRREFFGGLYWPAVHTGFARVPGRDIYDPKDYRGVWWDLTKYNPAVHRSLFYKDPLRKMYLDGRQFKDVVLSGAGFFDVDQPRDSVRQYVKDRLDWAFFFCFNESATATAELKTMTSSLQLSFASFNANFDEQTPLLSSFSTVAISMISLVIFCLLIKALFFSKSKKSAFKA